MAQMRKLTARSCLIGMAVALATCLGACGKTPSNHIATAQDYVAKQNYQAAAIALKSALQEEPDNRDARLALGQMFYRLTAYPEAEIELRKARDLGAADNETLPILARTLLRMGKAKDALYLDVPVQSLKPQAMASLQAARAEAHLLLGDRAGAEVALQEGKKADPGQPDLLLAEAQLALMDKQRDRAMQLLDQALEHDPQFSDAQYVKAGLLKSDGKADEAIAIYQKIVANDPSQFHADLAMADHELKKGNWDAADKYVTAAEQVGGSSTLVWFSRGVLELRRGNLEKANQALLNVLRVNPDHIPTLLTYAALSYGLGNYEASAKSARTVLGSDPNNLMAGRILSSSLLKSGDTANAIKILEPFLNRYPSDAKLAALAGEVYLQHGDFDKAVSYLDKAAVDNPANADLASRLAIGHFGKGDEMAAVSDLEQAVRLNTKPGQADLALVSLRLKLKQYDQALQDIAVLEKKLPNNPVTGNLRAAALLGKQDIPGARHALEQALSVKADFFPAAANLSQLDLAEHKPELARKRFTDLLTKDPKNLQAMLALAGIEAASHNDKEYVGWLEQAIRVDPKSLSARSSLVQFYVTKNDSTKALAEARSAVKDNPDSHAMLTLLGATQRALGDSVGAVDTYKRLALIAPDRPEPYWLLAVAQIGTKQQDAARENLQKALQINPTFGEALDAMMSLDVAQHRFSDALRTAKQLQTRTPTSPLGFDREGDIQTAQKHFAEAAKAFEEALKRGAGSIGMIKLHRAMLADNQVATADQRLSAWLNQHPKDLTAKSYAGAYFMEFNRDRDAIAQYEALLKLAPDSFEALNNLSWLYQKNGDKRALAMAEHAYKLFPKNPSVLDTLGWILVNQESMTRGLELLGSAAAGDPDNLTIRYHRGFALVRSGNKDEAKKVLEALLATGRQFPESEQARKLLSTL